jgi:hypothetical protein
MDIVAVAFNEAHNANQGRIRPLELTACDGLAEMATPLTPLHAFSVWLVLAVVGVIAVIILFGLKVILYYTKGIICCFVPIRCK